MKDAFDLWWEWAQKPHESFLMIDAVIHRPIVELSPEDRRDLAKVNEAVRRYRESRKCSTIAVADLRMTAATALQLRDLLDKALLVMQPIPGAAN
jgi:hypothetical protein